jgi:hypothetical protein
MTAHAQGQLKSNGTSLLIGRYRMAVNITAGGSGTSIIEKQMAAQANARRLAACWNTCQGIPTEALEDDALRKLRDDRDQLLAQRDELLAALLKISTHSQSHAMVRRIANDAIAKLKGTAEKPMTAKEVMDGALSAYCGRRGAV